MPEVESRGRYGRYIHNIITVGDFVVLNIAFVVAYLVLGRFTPWPLREVLMAVNVAYIPVAMFSRRMHKLRALYMERLVRYAILAVVMQALVFVLLIFTLGIRDIDPKYFAVYYPTAFVGMVIWWITARKILKFWRRRGRNFTRVIIVGAGPTAMSLLREMLSDAGFGYKIEGFFTDSAEDAVQVPEGYHVGSLDDITDFVATHSVDEVYYCLSGERHEVIKRVIGAAEGSVARFYYVPQINRYAGLGFTLHTVGSMPVLTLMHQPLESLFNRFTKRAFDLAFSSVLLILSPIVYIPVAIAIKLSSPGPVFFKQERTGYKGRSFMCYKFRTMRVNADADSRQATADDPRKTRLGDFLRRTSIDELPQFLNVWLGDMSVVGPRPHMLKHTEEYSRLIDRYMVRHYIKPGITGWAQVCGLRGQTDELWKMEKRVEHDVWYIQNWTFLLDIKIIYKTVTNAIRGEKNAF